MRLQLIVKEGFKQKEVLDINTFPAIFGRSVDCNYQIEREEVSRAHFIIEQKQEIFTICDMGSRNGTYVNGQMAAQERTLQNKDTIRIGTDISFQVQFVDNVNDNLAANLLAKQRKKTRKTPVLSGAPTTDGRNAPDGLGHMVRRHIDITQTFMWEPDQEKIKHSFKALTAIYEVVHACNKEEGLPFAELLTSLFRAIAADRGAVVLDDGTKNYRGAAYLDEMRENQAFMISQTILRDVLDNGVSVITTDPLEDRRYCGSASLRVQNVRSLICAPLLSDANVFGAIYLDRVRPIGKPFSIEDLELLAAIGMQVGGTIAKSMLLEKLKEFLQEKEQLLAALSESEERYALAARGANDGLWDWNLQTKQVYFSPRWKAMLGCEEEEISTCPEEWFRRVHPVDLARLKKDLDRHLQGNTPHFENEHRLQHKDGKYLWVLARALAVRNQHRQAIRIAGSKTDITLRKRAEEQILHDAFHDGLTGLPNRSLFIEHLQHAIGHILRGRDYCFAVLFLDLNRFKIINDSLGHLVGDQLLVATAKKLRDCIRPGDTIARFGGDEFTILLDDVGGVQEATTIAENITQTLAHPFSLDGQDVFTSVSIGITLSNSSYKKAADLLRDSDTAMYRAKEQGKAYEIFDKTMHTSAVSVLQMETDMRRAIDRQEFFVCYQPIVALNDGAVSGFEALLRWQHAQRGVVSPAEFIPLAEETGLILDLGWWVLQQACQQIHLWQKLFQGRPLTVSVNLSSRQFLQIDLVDRMEQLLQQYQLTPASLKLEITESIIMENAEAIMRMLLRLQNMNLDLYIDDFGTGYSSLSYLHRLPISVLKIDRSFIMRLGQDQGSEEIVRTIVNLARSLKMRVVAEGVETSEQLQKIRELQCDYGQGYLFAKPQNSEDTEVMLYRDPRW